MGRRVKNKKEDKDKRERREEGKKKEREETNEEEKEQERRRYRGRRPTFIVASSEADTMTLKTGWKMTRVTGLRWPLREYFSGGRGIHSLGSRLWVTGPPRVISSLASFSLDSSSITCQWRSGRRWVSTKYQ